MSHIGANELIFNKNDGSEIFGGGFSVNSIMMKGGISPIMTLNNNIKTGGGGGQVSDIFSGLAVPAYAYHNNYQNGGSTYKNHNGSSENEDDESDDDVIDDDLHDKLLGLVKEHESNLYKSDIKKKRTRKHKSKLKKASTRKNMRKANLPDE